MRVISGHAGGLKLKAPKGSSTRPTIDRVKESLFSILGPRVIDAKVLDLFAGTGALAIEALSRGAEEAILVDKDMSAIECIKDNLSRSKLAQYSKIFKLDFTKAIETCSRQGMKFDLIFVDPPYGQGLDQLAVKALVSYNLVADGGIIVVEHSSRESFSVDEKLSLEVIRSERYGDTSITLLLGV